MSNNPQNTTKHFVFFDISEELYQRVTDLIAELRAADDPRVYHKEVSQAVLDLVGVGFHFFFIDTLKTLKVGIVTQNTAKMGLKTLQRSMGIVIRRVVKSLNKEQFLKAAEVMENMMGERTTT